MTHDDRVDLVLEGGGVKGIGLVGAVGTLRTRYPDVQRVAGTSAGAIVASLIAAGLSDAELDQTMRSLDYSRFEQGDWLDHLGVVGKGLELLLHGGIYQTDYLHGWITEQLASHGVHTWGDLRYTDPDPDIGVTEQNKRYKLVVIVSDLSRGRMLRLPWDYQELCGLDPDRIAVADAVTASASIPFFFRAQHLTCGPKQNGDKLTLTDGGTLSNYPIGIFDRPNGTEPRWPTLGVKLSARMKPAAEWRPADNPIEMCMRLFETMMDAHDNSYVDQKSVQDRTVFVDTTGVSATNFKLTNEVRDQLFTEGQTSAAKFLATWNWQSWLKTYATTGD